MGAHQTSPDSFDYKHGYSAKQVSENTPSYAEICVNVPTGIYGDTFTYSIPAEISLERGHLVVVPFGNRLVHGMVMKLANESTAPYTKHVAGLVKPEPLLDAWQLDLAIWVSEYYNAPLFDAITPMLPPGLRSRTQKMIRLIPDPLHSQNLKISDAKLLAYLQSKRGLVSLASTVRNLGGWVPSSVKSLVRQGLLEELSELPSQRIRRQFAEYLELCVTSEKALELAYRDEARAPKRSELLRFMARTTTDLYPASLARRNYSSSVAALLRAGIVKITRTPLERAPTVSNVSGLSSESTQLRLTSFQMEALAQISIAIDGDHNSPKVFVLQGVTGSGKTEVYLRALAHCLERGKRAIVMVPELSLTPQTLERFHQRFPNQVASLHSGLTPGQHYDQWWRVHAGDAPVVIGSRGAIFAPQRAIGLIVLDEEHEWTYKQHDSVPRYHARDVAVKIAELTGAVVILGSATPEVISSYKARQGEYRLLRLPERLESSGSPIPLSKVQLVDMREELKSGNRDVFSRALKEELKRCVEAGNQAILFLNRRGTSSVVQCRDCGFVIRCWRCSTSYTYHEPQRLVCHHCNHRRKVPDKCPTCRSINIRYLGIGTQRVTEEIKALLPDVNVLRWDSDTASSGRTHTELLAQFSSGDAQILVGTQMIAKGLHVPSVTLVGAVLADIGLHVSDFRAAERSFQVLCQVAGRAGRGLEPGKVIVQTYLPENYAIQFAANQDYETFYETEIEYRRLHGNPPFGRLVRLIFNHRSEQATQIEAQRIARQLKRESNSWGFSKVDIIGPAPAYPPRLRNVWRWQILLRGTDPRPLLDKVALPPNWVVDIDPVVVV